MCAHSSALMLLINAQTPNLPLIALRCGAGRRAALLFHAQH